MSTQKLPVQGTLIKPQIDVPGQTGANYSTGVVTLPAANRVTIARFKSGTVNSVAVASGIATVTIAAGHLHTKIGQQVTFSGATVAGSGLLLNDQTWTISAITSATVFAFPCNIPDIAAIAGTIVQEPVFTLPNGWSQCTMNANANVEICVDNTNESPTGHSVAGVPTAHIITPTGLMSWQIQLVGGSAVTGFVFSDGFSTRIRCMGTTASSYYSVVG